jgi:hypothetical protein
MPVVVALRSPRTSSLSVFNKCDGREGFRDGRDLHRALDGQRVVAAIGECLTVGALLVTCRRRDERSSRATFVAVMQATDLGDRHDGAIAGRRDQTRYRRVLVQRQVSAGPFVVRTIESHQPLQACFVEHDDMI